MAKNGLTKWFAEKWVDISGPKKRMVHFQECGRAKQQADAKRELP
jgi:hypothetical protein